jgi:hypothetical protein
MQAMIMTPKKASKPAPGSTCAGCNESVHMLDTACVEVAGRRYHTSCFNCAYCHKGLSHSKFQESDKLFYHPECFEQEFSKTCDCCMQEIPAEVWSVCNASLILRW